MRVIHVVRQFAPSVGGLEAVVQQLAHRQQRDYGHDVRIVTLDRLFSDRSRPLPATEVVDGIPVRRLRWTGSARYPLCPQVVTTIADADLVHVHAIDFFFDWLSLTRMFHRKPLVASTHGGFFHTAFASTLKRLWFNTVTRFSVGGYRRLVAISANDGDVFRRITDRSTVVENGVDVERFRDAASSAVVPTILYFGRWSANKGLPALLDTLAALRATDPRWRLVVAGRPYDLSASAVERLVDAKGVRAAVEVHPSPSDGALRTLMGRASYFGCLSSHEGFGLAAIEAMSAGLVPLLSDIPPFRKIVEDSGIGVLLPVQDDAAQRASAIARLHAELVRGRRDERARCIAFSHRYEWTTVAERYEAVYREALAMPAS